MRLVTGEIVEGLSLATVGVNSLELSYCLYDKYILVFAENAVNYNRWDRGYPRRTPMETPGTDWATSAVIVPAAWYIKN